MPFSGFNVVLVGENFPINSIRVSDFAFRHRPLVEKLRVPVALQAENESVDLQVLPDRFEVNVKNPDKLDLQCEGIAELVNTFLEYVGKRTISAVGHNARWTVPNSAGRRDQLTQTILKTESAQVLVGASDVTADVSLFFGVADGRKNRLMLPMSGEGDLVLDFNFHFDLPQSGAPEKVVSMLLDSLRTAEEISHRVEQSVQGVSV